MTRDVQGNTIDRTVTVDAYVCWRVAGPGGVDQFVRAVGTPEGAKAILGQRINSELGAAIGAMELEDLISVKTTVLADGSPGRWVDVKRDRLRARLLDTGKPSLKELAREEYGIELIDV